MTDYGNEPVAEGEIPLLPPIRFKGLLLALMGIAVVGLPLAWWLAGAGGRPDLQMPAVVTGVIVIAASLVGLIPLWLTRDSDPMTQAVTGRLGHMVIRLLLTAGGLVFYLVLQPEDARFSAGLIALGWYLVGWVFEWIFLYQQAHGAQVSR